MSLTSTNITPKYCQKTHYNYARSSVFFASNCSPLLCYRFVSTTLTAQIPAKTLSQTHRVFFMLLCYNHAKTTTFSAQSSTGKERDSETGFSYFGARYYDSDLMTGWLSVDPLADKYPGLSPYNYCGWNPIRLVDPDGEEIDEPPLQRILNAISSKTNEKMESVKRPTILKNNIDAIAHYYFGQGKAIKLDNNLGVLLTQTEEFKEKHKKIVNGKTQSLTGNFGVDMTFVDVNTFFIGDTRVDYSIAISEDKSKCTVTYTLFAQDGFNDPNFIKETFGKILNGKLDSFNADREGNNLEFGGIPYDFIPQKKIYTFDNPGYENKQ